jgi:hypothetical protein
MRGLDEVSLWNGPMVLGMFLSQRISDATMSVHGGEYGSCF